MKDNTLYVVTINKHYIENYYDHNDSLILGKDIEKAKIFSKLKIAVKVATMLNGEVLIYSQEVDE